jgi:hypothetical protein
VVVGSRARLVVAASVVFAVAGIAGLLAVLSIEGLDRASVWAALFASAATLVGTAVAVWTLAETVRTSRRGDASSKAPTTHIPEAPQPMQKITASGQGSTAQGAMFGDVITHVNLPEGTDPTGPEPQIAGELPECRREQGR